MRLPLLSLLLMASCAGSNPCPDGYDQAPNEGDCFKTINFQDYFSGNYLPTSFDAAETECSNFNSGGLLASIHSPEDNSLASGNNRNNKCGISAANRNIGLKCKGTLCKWDDGSPITYTNFAGDGPKDSDGDSCYAIGNWGLWIRKDNCGEQNADCWVCRVKARTIECVDGEWERNGGCVSVHTTPLDQKTAEASCPGGGHLVSIHGNYDSDFYKMVALDAGVNGSIYIGGQYSNGLFEWSDGSYKNYAYWANGFPNTIFGTCVQMLLDSSYGVQGQWTNIDCATKQPYICYRDGANYGPTVAPQPKANAVCPPIQYYTGSGNIYSPNYPLSIPSQQTCEYVIGTDEGTRVSVKFTSYNCQSGITLSFYDGLNSNQPFLTFTTDSPTPNQSYTATSSVMKIVFTANDTSAPVGTGWEAEFVGI